ncbi:MAG: fatty acid desaturase [Elusimicrobia bacterium]|nr:fatty acid desaturase [Elusimicrobiota bacterium]
MRKEPLDWANILFLSATPLVAVIGTVWYVRLHGIMWLEIVNFAAMFLLTGMAVTGGYHRYYTHKSYEAAKPLQLFYLIFGAAAVENSVLNWASDHRYHHQFVDQEEDPYNILRGGFYAHIGWIFRKNTRALHARYRNVPDLLKDPLVRWQDRWYLFLVVAVAFGLPTLIGLIAGRPMGGLLWAGFLRVVVVHHMTFLINSVAHLYGSRPYTMNNSARDNWWLGPLTFGEGYHNFHHAFPADHRNGIRWYQFDLTKWWLKAMNWFGLAHSLRETPELLIVMARVNSDIKNLEQKFARSGMSGDFWNMLRHQLEIGRQRMREAIHQYHARRAEYLRDKDAWPSDVRRLWDIKVAQAKDELQESRKLWQGMLRATHSISQTSI